jgi:hypothetical protein
LIAVGGTLSRRSDIPGEQIQREISLEFFVSFVAFGSKIGSLDHEVVRHEEFLGNAIGQRDESLLDLCIDSDPTVSDRVDGRAALSEVRR